MPENVIADDQLNILIEWFKERTEEDNPSSLAMSFASISDFLSLRSDQLGLIVDLIDGNIKILIKVL